MRGSCPRRVSGRKPWKGSLSQPAGLGPVAEIVIGNGAGNHGLADGNCADADAGVVATLGAHLDIIAVGVDRLPLRQDRRGRLDREARDERLACRNAAEDAARVVGEEDRLAVIAHPHLVGILLARSEEHTSELQSLMRIPYAVFCLNKKKKSK